MKTLYPKMYEKDRKLVRDALLLGGIVSTDYAGITEADAVAIAGEEVLIAVFVDPEEAAKVARKLVEIGIPTKDDEEEFFFVYNGGKKIFFNPGYLLSSIRQSQEWKLKVSYSALGRLEKYGELYYSFKTGEIIVDNFPALDSKISESEAERIISTVFFEKNNKKEHYIKANKKFGYTVIGNVVAERRK